MSTFTLRFDEQTKTSLDNLCDNLGMNLTTFFMIYVKKSLRENKIPFEVSATSDPFYSEKNQKALAESVEEYKRGEYVEMSFEDFQKMVDAASSTNKKSN